MSTSDLPKSYTPAAHERDIRARWEAANCFHVAPDPARPPYSIVIPPPNVTAALHLGHALNNTLQDILIRFHRMKGCATLWMPGTDHAGIATQTVVDKRLQAEGKPALREHKLIEAEGGNGREQFIARIQAWKDEYEATITEQLKLMGCSCDFDRQRFTMDDVCAKAVREAFFRLFRDGLIYRGKRLVNWDPATGTALADDEVEMEEVAGKMYYLRYPLAPDSGTGVPPVFITVATTRPETMLGDTAVAINPKDPRAADVRGRSVILPIVGRVIPIIEDDYVVMPASMGGDPDDPKANIATGFLKVTPAHDPNDYEIGLRHQLPAINIFAPDASISTAHGWSDVSDEAKQFLGLSREEARQRIVEWFEQHGLLEKVVDYTHSVGHSYRSHVPIEPYLSDQWYVKVTDDRMRGEALRALAGEESTGGTDTLPGGTGILPVQTTHATRKEGVTDHFAIHRRNLPHWQVGGSTYFITFRLRIGELSEAERDSVADACRHWHGQRLHLHLMTVMPDHVHLLLTPLKKDDQTWYGLPELMHSIKGHTVREIQRRRGASGPLWQDEYFDRIVRDEEEFFEKWNYMLNNPVKAGLVESPEEYQWTVRGSLHEDGKNEAGRMPALHGQNARATRSGDGELRFFPDRYAKTFQQWHENIRDWCISRQIWWGHRIPVWSRFIGSGDKNAMREYLNIFAQFRDQIESGEMDPCHLRWCQSDESGRDFLFGEIHWDKEKQEGVSFVCIREDDPELIATIESQGFTRDPDVLDTWFSSGLWPLSTMGWPDPQTFPEAIPEGEALLLAFNPTSVLCTAREIITLWVSRMVMFNRYFTADDPDPARASRLPFRHVFIHPMIQDGHGQKMSKSLGNGVDPRDIIHTHGADALRFVLAQIATATQDVRMPVDTMCPHEGCGETFRPKEFTTPAGHVVARPRQTCPKCERGMVTVYGQATGSAAPTPDTPLARNTSAKFDLGRNFCNKLWNAMRFALANLEASEPTNQSDPTTLAPPDLTLADQWIIARLSRGLHKVEEAITSYQFNVCAEAVYDLVWRDFCDWYLEAIKPTIRHSPAQQRVLRAVLNALLRVAHPIMPFVTETLWPHARSAGEAGFEGLSLPPSDLLALAGWPEIAPHLDDDDAHDRFERIRRLVLAIRNVRGEHKVPPRRKITLHAGPAIRALIDSAGPVVLALAELESIQPLGADHPANSVIALFEGEELLLTGILAEGTSPAEIERLHKDLADLERKQTAMEGRLANPGYTEKAPPHLVQQTRDELTQIITEAARIRAILNREP